MCIYETKIEPLYFNGIKGINLHIFLPNSEYKIYFGNGDFKVDTNDLIEKNLHNLIKFVYNMLVKQFISILYEFVYKFPVKPVWSNFIAFYDFLNVGTVEKPNIRYSNLSSNIWSAKIPL